jgi:hypothetical protein
MAMNADQRATRHRVIAGLSELIGLPLTAVRRAADMRTFQFGKLRPVERGSVGDFALHVLCPWRIEGPAGIVTGREDLWEPLEEDAPFDENWHYETSPNLQDARMRRWLEQHGASLVVQTVDADDFGGASVNLCGGFVLRLFPAGARNENWRLFRPKTDTPHFVVSGGVVEIDAD